MPWTRLLGSVVLTLLTKIASGYWQILDPQNGFVAITRDALERIDLHMIDNRYFFENSMLISLNMISARCMDVRMKAAYGDERSNLSVWRVLGAFPPKLMRGLLRRILRRYLLLDFSPIFPLLTIGGLMLVGGTVWGSYHWWLSAVTGRLATTGTVMLAVLPVFTGLQMILQALVLDIENSRSLTVSEEVYLRDRRHVEKP
jgi:dolichol-phosphate mannosyltransferase